mgnify:CR=1 FL=1
MIQMTEQRYYELKKELAKVTEDLDEALAAQRDAIERFGDVRENEEYDTARNLAKNLNSRKNEIETMLGEAEIVPEDRSPRIVIGSVVDVTEVTEDGKPLSETRRFTVEAVGDTITKKILGVKSPLGQVVLNGTSSIYRIPTGGGIYYSVKKVLN